MFGNDPERPELRLVGRTAVRLGTGRLRVRVAVVGLDRDDVVGVAFGDDVVGLCGVLLGDYDWWGEARTCS